MRAWFLSIAKATPSLVGSLLCFVAFGCHLLPSNGNAENEPAQHGVQKGSAKKRKSGTAAEKEKETPATVQVLGLVNRPTTLKIPVEGLDLLDAINNAGGISTARPIADSENLLLISVERDQVISHFSHTLMKREELIQGFRLKAGDTVTVQEWVATDLVKGRRLRRPTSRDLTAENTIDWIIHQAKEAQSAGAIVEGLDEEEKTLRDRIKKKDWHGASLDLTEFAQIATQIRGDNLNLMLPRLAERNISSEAEFLNYTIDLADSFRRYPIRMLYLQQEMQTDWEFLKGYYKSINQDTSKPFKVRYLFQDANIYPLRHQLPREADLTNSENYPSMGGIVQQIGTDENAVMVLERDIDRKRHTFAFYGDKNNGAVDSLLPVLVFPNDQVSMTQASMLPSILIDRLVPLLERKTKR